MLNPDDKENLRYGFQPATFRRMEEWCKEAAYFLGVQLVMNPFERLKALKQNRHTLNLLGSEVKPSAAGNLRRTGLSPQRSSPMRASSGCSKGSAVPCRSRCSSSEYRPTIMRASETWCSSTGSSTTR